MKRIQIVAALLASALAGRAQFVQQGPGGTGQTPVPWIVNVQQIGTAPLPPGPNGVPIIGAVTQGSNNWTVNNSAVAGWPTQTGTGLSGPGVQRVTLSSDSSLNVAQWGGGNALFGGTPGSVAVGGIVQSGGTSVGTNPLLTGLWSGTTIVSQGNVSAQNDAAGGGSLAATGRWIYNGTNWDRTRSASLANFATAVTTTSRNIIGAQLAEKGSRWSVVSNPSSGSQATASIAAEASVRHVADCISWSGIASAATAAAELPVNLRDGATGAGTVIWTAETGAAILAAGGAFGNPGQICGLNLVGTTNTAMTFEFSSLLSGLIESVSISGFNVN